MTKEKFDGENLDLEKIQQAAFSAIDELFSEDNEKKDPFIVKLEEKILALDWEFSDKDLMELRETIQTLKESYTDKINKALLTMMDNISKFLLLTREAAPPNTLTVLGQIASAFKEINFLPLTEEEKKLKLTEVYKHFKELKAKVAEALKQAPKKPEPTPSPEITLEEKIEAPKIPEAPPVEEIEPAEGLRFEEPGQVEEIPPSPEITSTLPEPAPIISEIPSEIVSQLKGLQEKLLEIENSLSVQNSSLEHINTYLQSIEKQNFVILDNIKGLQERIEPLLDLKKEIEFIKQELMAFKKEKAPSLPRQEIPQETAQPPLPPKEIEKRTKEKIEEKPEPIAFPYVQLFTLRSHQIALPFDCIANVYSLSPKKIKKLLDKEKIRLKELKSFWRKLSKNMKGSLKHVKEKELEKMEVYVLRLSLAKEEEIQYNNAILIDCGKQYGVIFVSKPVGNKTFLPEKGEEIQEGDIETRVFIPEVGEVYLINPCTLLNRE